jgi:hypothetical protein
MKVTRVKVKVGNIPLEGSYKWCVVQHILWQKAWPGLLDDRCPADRPLHVRGFGALVLVSSHLGTYCWGVRLQTGAYHLLDFQLNRTLGIFFFACWCLLLLDHVHESWLERLPVRLLAPLCSFLLMATLMITGSERCVAGFLRGGFVVV